MARREAKRAILDAALAVFTEAGERQSKVSEICARAGVSNGALFHHFPTKEAIEEALYLDGIASYQAGLTALFDADPASPRAAVAAAVRHHLQWTEDHRDLARFMYNRGRPEWEPVRGSELGRLNREFIARVTAWLGPRLAAGEVRRLPGAVIAATVLGPAHFICRRWLSGQIEGPPTIYAEDLATTAWAALVPVAKAEESGRAKSEPDRRKAKSEPLLAHAARLDGLGVVELVRAGKLPNLAALDLIGARLIHVDRDRATISFQPTAEHADLAGALQGAIVACLLETAAGVAVSAGLAPGQRYAALQSNLLFQRALPLTLRPVQIRAAVLQRGDHGVVVEATLADEDDEVYARSTGSGSLWPRTLQRKSSGPAARRASRARQG